MKNIFLAIAFVLSLPHAHAAAKESTKKQTIHVCSKYDTQPNILACNLYREARGEGDKGMLAVGFATVNRKDNPRFPKEISKIVYQPGQFDWTATSGSFRVQDRERWERAVDFSKTLISLHEVNKVVYNALDFTQGSVYFHEASINPYWTKHMKRTIRVGNHIFYREDDKKA